MKDFRRPIQSLTIQQQRGRLIKRLVLLQAIGAPLVLGTAVSALAYFGGTALLPALDDPKAALNALIVCGAGLAVEGVFTVKTVLALAALKRQR